MGDLWPFREERGENVGPCWFGLFLADMSCACEMPIPVVFTTSAYLNGKIARCTVSRAGCVELRRLLHA